MRCDRCHRRLRNPGVPVTVGGMPFVFGPVCAARFSGKRKKAGPRVRVRRIDQPDLFAEVA